MKKWIICMVAVMCWAGAVTAQEDVYLPGKDKFQLCDNKSGGGFYWADTTSAHVWLMDTQRKTWIYCGKPAEATPGEIGTFLPYPNRNGKGMFLLSTSTGDGWYYDGKSWKSMGVPTPVAAP